jgi:uncharacterized protein YggE
MRVGLKFVIAAAISCLAAPVLGAEVDEKQPVIVVQGSGTASHPADFTVVTLSIQGEGPDKVSALKQLAEVRARVEQGLGGLPGAQSMKVSTGTLSIREARSPKCDDDNVQSDNVLSRGDCQIIGAVASLGIRVKVAPAPLAGDVASLAAQLGGSDIRVDDNDVADPAALQSQAAAVALANAKRQAELVAQAMGVRLGPIVRVDDNNSRRGDSQVEEFVVTGSRIPGNLPIVSITLAPPPITRDAIYTVTYSIIR